MRCDYYHVMKEIWPNKHNSGVLCFPLIKGELRSMLLSCTKDEWSFSYRKAREAVKEFPLMVEKLEEIYNNPSYYAGYYLKNIVGNLTLLGSVPAEINHSSICAYFGKGANWTLSYHMMILMERQHTHYLSLRRDIDRYMVEVACHMSKFHGDVGVQDKAARMNLSRYCYDKLWYPSFTKSFHLQFKLCDNGTKYRVWHSNAPLNGDNFATIPIRGRCRV